MLICASFVLKVQHQADTPTLSQLHAVQHKPRPLLLPACRCVLAHSHSTWALP
jgi:hypothetical protein